MRIGIIMGLAALLLLALPVLAVQRTVLIEDFTNIG
jgi:hypothetical protein